MDLVPTVACGENQRPRGLEALAWNSWWHVQKPFEQKGSHHGPILLPVSSATLFMAYMRSS